MNHAETLLARAHKEASEVGENESTGETLRLAQAAGQSFGRAFEHVMGGMPGCGAGARTLEEELSEFAAAAATGQCPVGKDVSGTLVASAAAARGAGGSHRRSCAGWWHRRAWAPALGRRG